MRTRLFKTASAVSDEADLNPVALRVLLQNLYGTEFLTWEPETLKESLEKRFGSLGPLTWERIQALRVLLTHTGFFDAWEVFEKISNTFCGHVAIFHLIQPLSADELALAVHIGTALVPGQAWSDEVQRYILAGCANDGLWAPGFPLREVFPELLKTYLAERDLTDAFQAVEARSGKASKIIPGSEDMVQVQVNRRLEIAELLRAFDAQTQEQIKVLPTGAA